jgi:hypothetical protein
MQISMRQDRAVVPKHLTEMTFIELDLEEWVPIAFPQGSKVVGKAFDKGSFTTERPKILSVSFLAVEEMMMDSSAIQASKEVLLWTFRLSKTIENASELFCYRRFLSIGQQRPEPI